VEGVLAGCFLDELPERLISDKAYDSDPLDKQLADECGIEMIAPNRAKRKRITQDKRALRRYRRRWKIERLFGWLRNYRRVVTRWDIASKTSSASPSSHACSCYSDIHEMAWLC
jgi:transposase